MQRNSFFVSAAAVLLLGGANVAAWADGSRGNLEPVLASANGTPVRRIWLPICSVPAMPDNFRCGTGWSWSEIGHLPCTLDEETGEALDETYYILPRKGSDPNMDWGDGNAVYDAGVSVCSAGARHIGVKSDWGESGYKVLARITGWIDHVEPAIMHGSLTLSATGGGGSNWSGTHSHGDIVMALQVLSPETNQFEDVAVREIVPGQRSIYEVETIAPKSADIRLEIRAKNYENGYFSYAISDVQLVAAQCFLADLDSEECIQ